MVTAEGAHTVRARIYVCVYTHNLVYVGILAIHNI